MDSDDEKDLASMTASPASVTSNKESQHIEREFFLVFICACFLCSGDNWTCKNTFQRRWSKLVFVSLRIGIKSVYLENHK